MSRKGNSIDNGMMENFFGLLKTQMFYEQKDKCKTIDDLMKAIEDYINYWIVNSFLDKFYKDTCNL